MSSNYEVVYMPLPPRTWPDAQRFPVRTIIVGDDGTLWRCKQGDPGRYWQLMGPLARARARRRGQLPE